MTASGSEGQPARRPGYRKRRRLRQFLQFTALVLFIYLLLGTRQESATWVPHDLFFRLDPLAGLSTMLASREWLAPMALGLITLATALVFGRAWCSWICPVGTVLDCTPARRAPGTPGIGGRWLATKYILLAATLVAAAFGSLTLLVLDPITLLFRTSGSAGAPILSLSVNTIEGWLYAVGWLRPALDWFDGLIRSWLLTEQPVALTALLLLAVFGAVMGLNAIRRRFWCRYLCPLGALLALTSRIAWLRYLVNTESCTSCGRCVEACSMGAIDPAQRFRVHLSECTTCLDCAEACPTGAIAFRGQWQAAPALTGYQPARRDFLGSLGLIAVGAALLRVGSLLRGRNPLLIRPPGVEEERLLSKCIRCGECSRVCPTGGLQPSLATAGWTGLWTPTLVSRIGYCDYSCTSCGRVCPTGAIPRLSLPAKRREVIGLAIIDEERCLPFADATPCIVCEEMCPVPGKAIWLDEVTVLDKDDKPVPVQQPHVVPSPCIGCGICEYQCPVEGESAIRIYAPEEAMYWLPDPIAGRRGARPAAWGGEAVLPVFTAPAASLSPYRKTVRSTAPGRFV